ncbi:MAG: Anthranilate phosphoribosyltransferase [Bacteroidetes bacterium]|nr:Anthranilate phosphoribosyltransferase [Bacteroidota bacterium]
MKLIFEKVAFGFPLTVEESYKIIVALAEQNLNNSQVAALMAFFIKRSISMEELTGFRKALLDLSVKVKLDRDAIDVCGTGGDHKNTFNISTISAVILAASGIPVAKHGNFGSTSVSGSSDVLNFMGYKFNSDPEYLNNQLNEMNICFIHAPLFHPALKTVAKSRKEMGVRTFFNLMGPLINPAEVRFQSIGVYNLDVARLYNYVLQQTQTAYSIVHSLDGYDEVSLTSSFKYFSSQGEKLFEPDDFGLSYKTQKELFGGETIAEAAKIFSNVLANSCTVAQKEVVAINTAFAMNCFSPLKSISECLAIAFETIESKKALQLFNKLIS